MKTPNIVSGSDSESRMSAQRYLSMAATLLHKGTAKKRNYSVSQDEGNGQSKGSPKSGDTPESHKFGCKRQRVALSTEQETCSRDGPITSSHLRHSFVRDVNTQELPRGAHVEDGLPARKKEGKLRAKKEGVEGSPQAPLAGSTNMRLVEYWIPVQLSNAQLELYFSTLITNSDWLSSSSKRGSIEHLQDVLVALRKCCDHPYVLDPSLQSSLKERSPLRDYLSIGIETSGKLQLLSKLLAKIREQGLRVLIVYKTIDTLKKGVGIGYILDDFIHQSFGEESYLHIFTQSCVNPRGRQAAVELSNERTGGRFIILTEYSSVSVNIRLSSADVVILFNGDWNPVNDIRALQRMKLHTESDNLRVFRLYSVYTLEEKILCLARDGAVANSNYRYLNWSVCHSLLAWGAAHLYERLEILHETVAFRSANSSEDDFVSSIMHELSNLLSSKFDDFDISHSIISKANWVDGMYCGNIKLHGERDAHSLDDVPSHVFWPSLLDGLRPRWIFLPEKSEKRRVLSCQRPSGIPEDGMGAVFPLSEGTRHNTKRRKMVRRSTEETLSHQERFGLTALVVAMRRTSCKKAGERKSIGSISSQSSTSLEQGAKETGSEERMNLSNVHNDTFSHIEHGDETHKQRTLESERKKKQKASEFFVTKARRTEALKEKYCQLEQDLIGNQYCESSLKQGKGKLDDKFKLEFQELCREMDERWANLRAADLSSRDDIDEQGLTILESSTGSVHEEPDDTQMNASPALTNYANPCVSPVDSILESESGNKTLTNDQMPTLSAEKCSPVPPVEGHIPVDSAVEQMRSTSVPAIADEPTLSGSSSLKQSDNLSAALTLENPNVSPVCSPPLVAEVGPDIIKESRHHAPKGLLSYQVSGEDFHDASDGILMLHDTSEASRERLSIKEATGSDSDKPASPVSLPPPSVPRTSDHVNTSDRSLFSGPELEVNILREHQNHSPQNDMPCSLAVSENQERGTQGVKDGGIPGDVVGLFHDDEETCEIPDAIPIGESEVAEYLSEEAPGNQHEGANGMHGTVSCVGSSPCIPLPNCLSTQDCSVQGSLDEGTADGELRQQFPAALSSSGLNGLTPGQMLLQQCTDQGSQPPVEMSSGVNSHVSEDMLCTLQGEIERIQNVEAEATKKHEDMLLQLESDRAREVALINERYDRLLQDAKNDLTQKEKELQARHEKINAQKALFWSWRLVADGDSPIDEMFNLPSPVQSTSLASSNGMQANAPFHSPQIVSQFPDLSTSLVARRPYSPMYHFPTGFQAGLTLPCLNPYLSSFVPSLPIQSHVFNPYQFNQQALNLCPSGSHTQQLTNLGHHPFPYGAPI